MSEKKTFFRVLIVATDIGSAVYFCEFYLAPRLGMMVVNWLYSPAVSGFCSGLFLFGLLVLGHWALGDKGKWPHERSRRVVPIGGLSVIARSGDGHLVVIKS